MQKPDGAQFCMHLAGSIIRNGGKQTVLHIVLSDVTERKLAQLYVRLRSAIAANMAEGVILVSTESGNIVYANPRLELLLAYSAAALVGRHISTINAGKECAALPRFNMISSELALSGRWQGDVANCRQDGSEITLRWTVSSFDDKLRGPLWVGVCDDVTEQRRAESERQQAYADMRSLSANTLKAIEAERSETARNVHDQLGAVLTSIRLKVEALASRSANLDKVAQAELMSVAKLAQEAIRSTRDLCNRMHPTMLEDLGVVETCRWYAHEWATTSGIKVRFRVDRKVPICFKKIGIDLFRILQELLTNVARHSGASLVRITLSDGAHNIRLRVADNGQGVLPNSRTTGFGLSGIRERVAQHGGHFDFQSGPSGTIAVVTILGSETL
jgi:PAS domain S-box-containing protein